MLPPTSRRRAGSLGGVMLHGPDSVARPVQFTAKPARFTAKPARFTDVGLEATERASDGAGANRASPHEKWRSEDAVAKRIGRTTLLLTARSATPVLRSSKANVSDCTELRRSSSSMANTLFSRFDLA
jgi:hypothetical protein